MPARFFPSKLAWLGRLSLFIYILHPFVQRLTSPIVLGLRSSGMQIDLTFCLSLTVEMVIIVAISVLMDLVNKGCLSKIPALLASGPQQD